MPFESTPNPASPETSVSVADETLPAQPAFPPDADGSQPLVMPRSEHRISRKSIDPDALSVLYRLAGHHYRGFLVGGSVRDLLLGRRPKDFDVGTDAQPREIRRIFRNAFIIGRRFRLAHIKFGGKIIETSTFRKNPEPPPAAEGAEPDASADLLQRDDNTFGSPAEDAHRRDFTVNGLFYDIRSFAVIDYVGGIDDLRRRRIRAIGDADTRFREDPIRMLRAVRFASRLGFSLEEGTRDAVLRRRGEIAKASPPRLLEEILRLFAFDAAEAAFRLMRETGLLAEVLPELTPYFERAGGDEAPLWRYLAALDRGDTVCPEATPALLLATMFHDPLVHALAATESGPDALSRLGASKVMSGLQSMFAGLSRRLCLPRRMRERALGILLAQTRFDDGRRRAARVNMAGQDWFPEALALREMHQTAWGRPLEKLAAWRLLCAEQADLREERRAAAREQGRRSRFGRDRDRDRDEDEAGLVASPSALKCYTGEAEEVLARVGQRWPATLAFTGLDPAAPAPQATATAPAASGPSTIHASPATSSLVPARASTPPSSATAAGEESRWRTGGELPPLPVAGGAPAPAAPPPAPDADAAPGQAPGAEVRRPMSRSARRRHNRKRRYQEQREAERRARQADAAGQAPEADATLTGSAAPASMSMSDASAPHARGAPAPATDSSASTAASASDKTERNAAPRARASTPPTASGSTVASAPSSTPPPSSAEAGRDASATKKSVPSKPAGRRRGSGAGNQKTAAASPVDSAAAPAAKARTPAAAAKPAPSESVDENAATAKEKTPSRRGRAAAKTPATTPAKKNAAPSRNVSAQTSATAKAKPETKTVEKTVTKTTGTKAPEAAKTAKAPSASAQRAAAKNKTGKASEKASPAPDVKASASAESKTPRAAAKTTARAPKPKSEETARAADKKTDPDPASASRRRASGSGRATPSTSSAKSGTPQAKASAPSKKAPATAKASTSAASAEPLTAAGFLLAAHKPTPPAAAPESEGQAASTGRRRRAAASPERKTKAAKPASPNSRAYENDEAAPHWLDEI